MSLFNRCHPDISIICIWPYYPIELGGGTRTNGSSAGDDDHPRGIPGDKTDTDGDFYAPLGHAGILLIKGGTGPAQARYYEYGRYRVEGGHPAKQGNVRDYAVTTIVLDDTGWPTVESLHRTLRDITDRSGRNTFLHGNVDHLCGKNAYEKAVEFAEEFKGDDSQHYDLVSNSCMMFSFKVNHAGGWSWMGPIPVLNSYPADQMEGTFGPLDFGIDDIARTMVEKTFNNYVTYNPDGDEFHESVWQISS